MSVVEISYFKMTWLESKMKIFFEVIYVQKSLRPSTTSVSKRNPPRHSVSSFLVRSEEPLFGDEGRKNRGASISTLTVVVIKTASCNLKQIFRR